MKLWRKQARFVDCLVQLIRKLSEDYNYRVVIGEVYRPPETAELYEKMGKGIKDSVHCSKLAADLMLFYEGEYLTSTEEYKTAGAIWKTLDPEARWGGDFKSADGIPKPDGNHFSFEHLGHQ
jgi:hypothetical protein